MRRAQALLEVKTSYRNTKTDHEFEFKLGRLQVGSYLPMPLLRYARSSRRIWCYQIDNQTDKGPEIVLAPDMNKSEVRAGHGPRRLLIAVGEGLTRWCVVCC